MPKVYRMGNWAGLVSGWLLWSFALTRDFFFPARTMGFTTIRKGTLFVLFLYAESVNFE